MRDRDALKALSRLLDVQRARRAGAQVALAQAQEADRVAREAEVQARRDAEAAQDDWMRGLADPGFPPDYQRALAGRVLAREQQGAVLASAAERAAQSTQERQDEWRTSEARVRSGERSARALGRKLARRQEERRLADLADRATSEWPER